MKLNLNQSFEKRNPNFKVILPIESILRYRINHILYIRKKGENYLIPNLFISYDRKGGEGFFFYIEENQGEFVLGHFSDQFELGEYIGELNCHGKESLIKIIPYELGIYSGGEDIKSKIFLHSFKEV